MSSLAALLLRGVNVGGVTVRSAPLRACLESIEGVEQAATVLASGNAVVRTGLDPEPLRVAAEAAVERDLGAHVPLVVQTLAQVDDLVATLPYALDDERTHAYITLAQTADGLDPWVRLAVELDQEHTRLSPTALAWTCPVGRSLDTPFARAQGRGRLPGSTGETAPITTRNARTLARLQAAADKLG